MLFMIRELYSSTWLCWDSLDINLSSAIKSSKLRDGMRESNEIVSSGIISFIELSLIISFGSNFWLTCFFASIFSSKIKFTSIGLLNTEVCWDS